MRWLNRERLAVYPKIIVVMYLVVLVYWFCGGPGLIKLGGPMGGDFSHYWMAGSMALQGESAAVYDSSRLAVAMEQTFGQKIPLVWIYPPVFLLLLLPLALLPYLVSLVVWLGASLWGYLLVLRRLAPHPATVWLALAFPGTLQNIIHGQNGFLSAMLLGLGLLLLERRPVISGLVFGLSCYKPHLALLIPVALLAGRRWQALGAMAVAVLGLILASYLILGSQVWSAFLNNLSTTTRVLETGALPGHVVLLREKVTTIFSAILMAGGGTRAAWVGQGAVMLLATAAVVWAWARPAPPALRGAVLVLSILLFPPYEFIYDLAMLALPLAWLGWEGFSKGWRPGEPTALFIGWLTPLLAPVLAKWLSLQVVPLVLLMLLILALRRLEFVSRRRALPLN
jgi:hypothetical protein